MKISGVEIRPGNNIEYDGSLWRAVKIQHTQPGKGGAYMQVELKNLIDGRKNNVRFRSAETVERSASTPRTFNISMPRATCSSSWIPRPMSRSTCHRI
jgi:translation elongation factor P/translation initiation factor 5A